MFRFISLSSVLSLWLLAAISSTTTVVQAQPGSLLSKMKTLREKRRNKKNPCGLCPKANLQSLSALKKDPNVINTFSSSVYTNPDEITQTITSAYQNANIPNDDGNALGSALISLFDASQQSVVKAFETKQTGPFDGIVTFLDTVSVILGAISTILYALSPDTGFGIAPIIDTITTILDVISGLLDFIDQILALFGGSNASAGIQEMSASVSSLKCTTKMLQCRANMLKTPPTST